MISGADPGADSMLVDDEEPSGKVNEDRDDALTGSPALALALALSVLVLHEIRLACILSFLGLSPLPLAVPVLAPRL